MRPAHGPNILICESGGFRNTVATMAIQQNLKRLRQLHLVPHRDEDGLGPILGPQDCAQYFPLAPTKGGMGPTGRRWFVITSGKA